MHLHVAAPRALAIFISAVLPASPSAALDRGRLQQLFPAPYSVGERDGSLPIWPIFKQASSRDELVAYVFDYVDFAPAPNSPGEHVDRLVAIRPSGEFLEVLVIGPEKPGILKWFWRQPRFNFVGQDRSIAKTSPDIPQSAVELSRDYVRARLGLAADDRAHGSPEFAK
jgi:hypothetical protein